MGDVANQTGLALAPLLATCALTGVAVTVLQTRGRIARESSSPTPSG